MISKRHNITRKLLYLLVLLTGLMAVQVIAPKNKTYAITNNNSQLPGFITSLYEPANHVCISGVAVRNFGQDTWLSPAGAPKTTVVVPSFNIPYGQTSQNLWMNVLSTVCSNNITSPVYPSGTIINKHIKTTRNRNTGVVWTVDGAPPVGVSVSGLSGTGIDLGYNKAYFFQNRYVVMDDVWYNETPAHTEFTVSGLNTLSVGAHTITVYASTRQIHENTNGSFSCVKLKPDGTVQAANGLDDPICGSSVVALELNINILPPPSTPPTGAFDAPVCTPGNGGLFINGWAVDDDVPGQAIDVHFYFYRTGTTTNPVASYNSGAANTYGADLVNGIAAKYGPNHRFSTDSQRSPGAPIPQSWVAANLPVGDYDIYAYAIGINSSGVADGANPSLPVGATRTFNSGPCGSSTYTLNPSATCNADLGTIVWSVQSTGIGNPPNAAISYSYRKNGGPLVSNSASADLGANGSPGWTATTSGLNLAVGDRVTYAITVTPGTGIEGGAAGPATTYPTPAYSVECIKVGKPYLQSYRGDMSAGQLFGTYNPGSGTEGACGTGSGNVKTFGLLGGSGVSGSFVEYGLFANGAVDLSSPNQSFFSQVMSGKTTGTGRGLTFANTPGAGGWNNPTCIKDYYGRYSVQSPAALTAAAIGSFVPYDGILRRTGDLTITASTVPAGKNIVILVDGNVTVNSPLSYAPSTAGDVPSLMIVARGNIFFDKAATSVDGIWVAQPSSPTNGVIDTCSNGSSPYALTALFANCNSKFKSTGSLIARKIQYSRTLGDIYITNDDIVSTNAAEQLNANPRVLFRGPPLSSSLDKGLYDSLEVLPPRL